MRQLLADHKIAPWILGLLTTALLLPILLLPLNSDNDVHQAIAFAMYKGKGIPFLGSWDHNFPGVAMYHWLGLVVFGPSELGFRIIDLLNHLWVAYLSYRIASHLMPRRLAWVVPPLVAVVYAGSGFWNLGQRDGFAVAWLLIVLLLILEERKDWKTALLIALSISAATFIRPTNLAFILLPIGYFVWIRNWKPLFIVTVGVPICLLMMMLPWILSGRLDQFYFSAIRYNLDVYSTDRGGWDNLVSSLSTYTFVLGIALAGLGALIISIHRKEAARTHAFMIAYIIIAALCIFVIGKYHIYHFELIVPVACIFAGYSVLLFKAHIAQGLAAATILAIVAILYFPRSLVSQFVRQGANADAARMIAENTASFRGYGLRDERRVIDHLTGQGLHANDVEFMLLWPGLRWRSGFPGISRFTTTYALTMPSKSGSTSYQDQWQREYDSLLFAAKPKLIVAAKGPEYLAALRGMSPDSLLHSLPQTRGLIQKAYRLDTTIGGFNIYRRNEADH